MAILQLFVYRTADALQQKGLLVPEDMDLKETIVLTPEASSISTLMEIIGDILRSIEENIKDLSLTTDVIKIVSGFASLFILSVLGKVRGFVESVVFLLGIFMMIVFRIIYYLVFLPFL